MDYWYTAELQAFDNQPRPAAGTAIVFYGSSSVRLWEHLAEDFADRPVLNRGFGGSTLEECLRCFDRVVMPLAPKALLIYAGDNDLGHGADADHLFGLYQRLRQLIADRLPGIPWAFVSIKPSPSRRHLLPVIRRVNQLIADDLATVAGARYIDVFTAMLDEHERPPFRYFTDDWLHLNRDGYRLWQKLITPWVESLFTGQTVSG